MKATVRKLKDHEELVVMEDGTLEIVTGNPNETEELKDGQEVSLVGITVGAVTSWAVVGAECLEVDSCESTHSD